MSGNDNRDNASYRLDVTLNSPATVYMLIDNRLSDADNANPPTFDATHMQWILDQGWTRPPTVSTASPIPRVPDEVAFDEGVRRHHQPVVFGLQQGALTAGTFSILQADNAGQNMYGVVVVPEPATLVLLGLGGFSLLVARRRKLTECATARRRFRS